MNALGNIIWIIFGGWLIFLFYLFGSLILLVTIIGIPFGVQTFKLAFLALLPFGKEVNPGKRAGGCLYIVMNILWIVVAGVEIAITHLMLAFLFAITIIGIPFARQHLKLAYLGLVPFGNDIREVG